MIQVSRHNKKGNKKLLIQYSQCKPNMNNYRIISDIGSGAYSTVHKAIDVNTGHIVAIKKISQQNMNIKHIINRQVTFLHECIDHPNIIQLYKCFSLVFQYMPMDLISFYKSVQQSKNRNLNQEQICYISYQLCKALKFLHEKGIMHRDIKPQNILIDPQNLVLKLIDFGFAKQTCSPVNTNYMVTRWYRPMQIVLNLAYNQKVDVFATGALLLQLYLGHQIFRSSSNVDQFYWIVKICGFPSTWSKGHQASTKMCLQIGDTTCKRTQLTELINDLRPLAADLIAKMLRTSPQERLSIVEAYDHAYFSRFKVKSHLQLTKYTNYPSRVDSSIHRYDSAKIVSLNRAARAFSTQQQPNLLHVLSIKQKTKNNTDKSDLPDDESKQDKNNSGSVRNKQHQDSFNKMQYIMNHKKPFIRRVSQEKNQNALKVNQILKQRTLKTKVQYNSNAVRNRIKSLNQHGINVFSLKKLKIHRCIQNQKSRQKIALQKQNPTVKIHPKKENEREKPMFLRVKNKINDGKLLERGQQKQNIITTAYNSVQSTGISSIEHNKSVVQIPTKILSSAALKVKKMSGYNQYKFND